MDITLFIEDELRESEEHLDDGVWVRRSRERTLSRHLTKSSSAKKGGDNKPRYPGGCSLARSDGFVEEIRSREEMSF